MRHLNNLALAVSLAALMVSANSATFTVTNTNDSGAGSLRDAITQANANPSPDTVDFATGLVGTIVLTSGQIGIEGPLSVVGPGADNLTIDGNANSRIFAIRKTSPECPALDNDGVDYLVSISGLKLINGLRGSTNQGGAIYSEHSLTLDSVAILNSMAAVGGGLAFSVQYSGQALTINNTLFFNNFAKPIQSLPTAHSGGALYIGDRCGSLPTTSPVPVNITNSAFGGNRVQPVGLNGFGGAIGSWSRADVVISDTRIVDNAVDAPNPLVSGNRYRGGAIYGTLKSLTIQRSEIAGNAATAITASNQTRAGAIGLYNDDPAYQTAETALAFKLINSTVSGNLAADTAGAIWLFGNVAMEVTSSTISSNAAENNRTGGIVLTTGVTTPTSSQNASPPTFTAVSSIFADSAPGTVDFATDITTIPSFTGNMNNSLVETVCGTCNINAPVGSGNLMGVDPKLGILAFNGGVTRTHALMTGSPAVDAGSNPLTLSTDQRAGAFARSVGAQPDIGAFETGLVAAPDAPTLTRLTPGKGLARVAFVPPASNGGGAITSYTASCTGNGATRTASGTTSPITVTGLTNGVNYSCSVSATNSGGAGGASAALAKVIRPASVTPLLGAVLD